MSCKSPHMPGLSLALLVMDASAMGIRSFVALPLEAGGTVLRFLGERNQDENLDTLTTSLAYGVSARQTLFFSLPYRSFPDAGDRLGDVNGLYRYTALRLLSILTGVSLMNGTYLEE